MAQSRNMVKNKLRTSRVCDHAAPAVGSRHMPADKAIQPLPDAATPTKCLPAARGTSSPPMDAVLA